MSFSSLLSLRKLDRRNDDDSQEFRNRGSILPIKKTGSNRSTAEHFWQLDMRAHFWASDWNSQGCLPPNRWSRVAKTRYKVDVPRIALCLFVCCGMKNGILTSALVRLGVSGWSKQNLFLKMLIRLRSERVQKETIKPIMLLPLLSDCFSQGFSLQSNTLYTQWLRSPSYPNNYPPTSNCLWSLQRPTSAYAVKLTFNSFFLESKSSCSDDYVEIRDGDVLSTSKLIGKFCGSRLPPIIVSNYKYMFVRFVSDFDSYPSIRKFSATFRAIVPGTREIISGYYVMSLFTHIGKILVCFGFWLCMSINLHQNQPK